MRQIKFRAKSVDEGKWLVGSLIPNGQRPCIAPFKEGFHLESVDPSTVGQFTGLLDCNGKEIYEGDYITIDYKYDDICNGGVIPDQDCFCEGVAIYMNEFACYGLRLYKAEQPIKEALKETLYLTLPLIEFDLVCDSMEILGNIYDNPELLK